MRSPRCAALCWLAFAPFTIATVCNEGEARFYPSADYGGDHSDFEMDSFDLQDWYDEPGVPGSERA